MAESESTNNMADNRIQVQQDQRLNVSNTQPQLNLPRRIEEDVDEDIMEILYYQCQICHQDVECSAVQKHVAYHAEHDQNEVSTDQKPTDLTDTSNTNHNRIANNNANFTMDSQQVTQGKPQPQQQVCSQIIQQSELLKMSHCIERLQPATSDSSPNVPIQNNVNFYGQCDGISNSNNPNYSYQASRSQIVYRYPGQYQQPNTYVNPNELQHSNQYTDPNVDFTASAATIKYYSANPVQTAPPHMSNNNQHQSNINYNNVSAYRTPDPRQFQTNNFSVQAGQVPVPVQFQSIYNNYNIKIQNQVPNPNVNPNPVNNNGSVNYNNSNFTNVNSVPHSLPSHGIHPNNYNGPSQENNSLVYSATHPYSVSRNPDTRFLSQQPQYSHSNHSSKEMYFSSPSVSANERQGSQVNRNTPSQDFNQSSGQQFHPRHHLPWSPQVTSSINKFYDSNSTKDYGSSRSSFQNAQIQSHHSPSPSFRLNTGNCSNAQDFNYNSSFGTNNQSHRPSPSQQSQHAETSSTDKLPFDRRDANAVKLVDVNPPPAPTYVNQPIGSSPHSVTTEEAGSPATSCTSIFEPEVKFQTYETITPPLDPSVIQDENYQQTQKGSVSESLEPPDFSTGETVATAVPTDVSIYPCELCNELFFSTISLVAHVNLYHQVKLQTCEECGKKFEKKAGLLAHINRMHNPINIEKRKERAAKKLAESRKNQHPYVIDSRNIQAECVDKSTEVPCEAPPARFQIKFICVGCQAVFPSCQDVKVHELSCDRVQGYFNRSNK